MHSCEAVQLQFPPNPPGPSRRLNASAQLEPVVSTAVLDDALHGIVSELVLNNVAWMVLLSV